MPDPIESVVLEASRPTRVVQLAEGVFGQDGRLTPGAEVVAIVKLVVQPSTGVQLQRALEGDTTGGAVTVWASTTDLAAAYLEGDIGQTPLGWTELQVAPARESSGPPGARIHWQGREYEVTSTQDWTQDGLIPLANLRGYVATERRRAA